LTAIEIPSSVETIGERIFRRCTGLVNVTFEKGSRLTSITGDCVKDSGNRVTSYGAFLECTSLTKIEIPASVTTIGSGAFVFCSSLEIVSFEEGSKLITIKDGYKDGGNTVYGAFTNCDNLTLFDASNCTQIKTIGNYAFIYASLPVSFLGISFIFRYLHRPDRSDNNQSSIQVFTGICITFPFPTIPCISFFKLGQLIGGFA